MHRQSAANAIEASEETMNWLINTLGTSIGKKLLMAVTGICFCAFLVAHLAGNLTLYGGKDLFNAYAEHLHSLGPLVMVAQWILLLLAVVHVLIHLFHPLFCGRGEGTFAPGHAGADPIAKHALQLGGG